jgi:phosphoglycolate phosphatase
MVVIWDLDGTVWDSEPGIAASLAHALSSLGMVVPPEDELRSFIGPPLRLMLGELGVPGHLVDDGVARYRERYLTVGVYEAELYEGAEAALDTLLDDGHRLATATSKGEDPTLVMLEHFGILDRFEVVGAATMDGTVNTKAEVLARALTALGDPDPATCTMVGDRHYDVTGSAAFGIPCIGAAWGYGGADELRLAGAVVVAERPLDVPPLVDRR